MNEKNKYVYKILTFNEWSQFKKKKYFFGSKFDVSSNFIHLSTKQQIKDTLRIYFYKSNRLVLLKFLTILIKKKLTWEVARQGILFPHFYGMLSIKSIDQKYIICTKRSQNMKIN